MKHSAALRIAEGLVREFRPYCERMEIAGSIRRGKAEVGDIEIVAVPKLMAMYDMFGEQVGTRNELDHPLGWLLMNRARFVKNGPRYKQIALPEGIKLDLFLVLPPAQWGVIFAIRTGPAEFSRWIVTSRTLAGALPAGYKVKDGSVRRSLWEEGFTISMPEEIEFLNFLGLGWIEPEERRARWGDRFAKSVYASHGRGYE